MNMILRRNSRRNNGWAIFHAELLAIMDKAWLREMLEKHGGGFLRKVLGN